MSSNFVPEVVRPQPDNDQTLLLLATEGVLRRVWDPRYGSMLMEAVARDVFVNGQQLALYAH